MNKPELAHNSIRVADAAEHAEAIRPFNVAYDQMVVGPYEGHIESVASDDVVTYHEIWNRRLCVTGEAPSDHFVFGTVLKPSARMNWCGQDLSSERIALGRPSSPIDLFTNDDESHIGVMVTRHRWLEYIGTDEPELTPANPYHAHCDSTAGRNLIETISGLIAQERGAAHSGRAGLAKTDFETAVLDSLARCIARNPTREASASKRDRALRDTLELIRYSVIPSSVPEIAAAVGVSQRTLEYAFRDAFGVTPLQFIRRQRMNGAHRDLRIHDRTTTTVASVAEKWGFTEPGRFAIDYRRIFGRSPSVTLASRRNGSQTSLAPAGY